MAVSARFLDNLDTVEGTDDNSVIGYHWMKIKSETAVIGLMAAIKPTIHFR